MKSISFLLITALVGGLSLGVARADCSPKERQATNQSFDLKGWLVYSPNGIDARLRNLSSGDDRLIYDDSRINSPLFRFGLVGNNVTLVDHNNVIFASPEYGRAGLYLIRRGKVFVLIEDKTGSIIFRNPVFFAAHEKLLYVREERDAAGDEMAYLYEATIKGDPIKKKSFEAIPKSQIDGSYIFLTKISDDKLLFKHHSTGYVLYDLKTSQFLNILTRLEEDCSPIAWRGKTEELICGEPRDLYLWDMDGNKRRIPGEVPHVVNAYVPGDYLIGYNFYLTDGGRLGLRGVIYDFEREKSWPFPVIANGRADWYDIR